ncbi:hypothetical protein [Algoriphagus sp. CAU 1675]|uniref:hypothetical protein n=1 Tax=Algoriphagus sp. CAU 1675 TaxID=3032597 RepID=UPI0023D9D2A2|nr:hypothetical protein [Algoriphagus sp. CAU 1675]MDF2158556.1 hypothetical protein [Algoriphagus sp. CAU 1675]
MKFFYLSSRPNKDGLFEIHDRECELIPDALNRDYLGPFNNGKEAMRKAKSMNDSACLCRSCCNVAFQAVFVKSNQD